MLERTDDFQIFCVAKNAVPAPAGDFLHQPGFDHGLQSNGNY